jgi:hypothetical protein
MAMTAAEKQAAYRVRQKEKSAAAATIEKAAAKKAEQDSRRRECELEKKIIELEQALRGKDDDLRRTAWTRGVCHAASQVSAKSAIGIFRNFYIDREKCRKACAGYWVTDIWGEVDVIKKLDKLFDKDGNPAVV